MMVSGQPAISQTQVLINTVMSDLKLLENDVGLLYEEKALG